VTKDRRLGRGLAALLGTPVEEGNENATTVNMIGSAGVHSGNGHANFATNDPTALDPNATRQDTIRQLANEARAAQSRSSASPISIPMGNSTSSYSSTSDRDRDSDRDHANRSDSTTLEIPVGLVDANPFQPRRQFNPSEIESLAESLKEHKQLQPVLVRKVGERYQLISGERRLRATVLAGLPTIRAEVRVADDRLVAELAIIENLQRKDLNAIEKALSFKRYITEHKCTQDELAGRLKIDRSTIANMMRLLELPDIITDAVQRDEISAGHAKALLSLGSIKEQIAALKRIREEGWSVRETEAQVADMLAQSAEDDDGILAIPKRRKASKSDQLTALERDLKMALGTRVEISQTSRGRGRITIHFTSVEEFDRLRSSLSNEVKRKAA
jgi:ParB family transcriptional regulator, chromosome partitioning protein